MDKRYGVDKVDQILDILSGTLDSDEEIISEELEDNNKIIKRTRPELVTENPGFNLRNAKAKTIYESYREWIDELFA